MARQLTLVQALDIAPMILVEICQSIVVIDGGRHVVGEGELERADGLVPERVGGVPLRPPSHIAAHGVGGGGEGGRHLLLRHIRQAASVRVEVAVSVVDGELLHAGAGQQQQPADGGEYDADEEEQGQDGAGREDGLPGLEALLAKRRVCWLPAPRLVVGLVVGHRGRGSWWLVGWSGGGPCRCAFTDSS